MDASWDTVTSDFEPDGTLRDIYVHGTTLADWEVALDLIRRNYARVTFTENGKQTTLPSSVNDVFALRDNAAISLDFEVAGIDLACHFFTPEEIEFDLWPEQVNSQERFRTLQDFLRVLATALRKTVFLTPENCPDSPILIVDSSGEARYSPLPDAT